MSGIKKTKGWGEIANRFDAVIKLQETKEGQKLHQIIGAAVEYSDGNRFLYLDIKKLKKLEQLDTDVLEIKIFKK